MTRLKINNFYILNKNRYFHSEEIKPIILHDNNNMLEDTWIEYRYKSDKIIISKDLLNIILQKFNNDVILKLKENQYIFVLLKLKMLPENSDKSIFRSLTKMQRINKESIWNLIDIFFESWLVKSSGWGLQSGDNRIFTIKEIIYSYKIIPIEITGNNNIDNSRFNRTPFKIDSSKKIEFSGYNLPNTMDFTKWGEIINHVDDISKYNMINRIIIKKLDSNAFYHINQFENYNFIEYKVNDTTILKFTDESLDPNNLSTFRRTVDDKKTFDFKNGSIVLKRKINFLPKIENLKTEKTCNNKFLTMDIETARINGELIPYCICIFNQNNKIEKTTFYLTDYNNNSEDMLIASIKFLMKRKFDGYKVYLHNFSNFDGVFFLRILVDLARKIDPLINDGDFINIQFNFDKRYRLSFRDSYLMLPSSLRDLCESFKVIKKGIFPIYFLMDNYNSNIDFNYIGPIPDYIFFSGILEQEFNNKFKDKSPLYWKLNKFNGITPKIYLDYVNNYKDKNSWNLREETIKYCMNDCESLFEVIFKFSKEIFDMFNINVLTYPTLSSLAFAIFRTKFMKHENIPLISGPLYDFIKEGYYGGHVDVYKPHGFNIRRYDGNSLYPSVMKPNDMPVGNPITFEGDISSVIKDPFGFFKVKVITPLELKHPILLKRIQTNNGRKTIAPLGTWIGVYSTIEINKCKELGYKFEILSGVLFEKENIFKNYIDFFYDIKKNVSKADPKYMIAKLFLNTLYGRFGMDPCLDKHKIVDKIEFYKLNEKYGINTSLDLKNGKELVTYNNYDSENDFIQIRSNVSVPISAMVTSYARIFMSQFKNNPNFNLYYSDTDSIDIDTDLDIKYIGNELGEMKLENIFDEVVYLAPKVYGAKINNEDLVKVKGLKNPVNFEQLKSLLNKNETFEAHHDKWFKNIPEGKIYIKDEIYTLAISDSKRELIFDNNNNFIGTKPLYINEND